MLRLLIVAILLGGIAHADAPKPWADGVPADKQQQALALYRDGNALFEQDQYKDALPKYQAALALWDHPAIHYNAAVCLINLERPVEAYEQLVAALRYGAAPLGDKLYKDALNYKKALSGQIAPLEVTCKQSDAKVTLDGADLLACPATVEKTVLAAEHQLVTVKPGYETDTRTIRLQPGKKTTLVIELHPLPSQRKLVRRWNRWLPWSVVGAGAAAALAGVPLLVVARSNIHTYDADVAADCPDGCPASQLSGLQSTRDKAYLERDVAYGMMIGGGVVIAAGVALVVANQPHFEHAPLVAPQVGADRVGVIISGRW